MSDELILAGHSEDFPQEILHAASKRADSPGKIKETFRKSHGATWFARDGGVFAGILRNGVRSRGEHRLLVLERLPEGEREALLTQFRYVLEAGLVRLLPADALAAVLSSKRRGDLFIGVTLAPRAEAVVLYRGDLQPLVVPREWFRETPAATKPDFDDVEVIDHGQTVRLGSYEAATEALLYEMDPEYRRRAKARRLQHDKSFGGALRRLRLQKGLSRDDFPGVGPKEIARIERGEVAKPRDHTMRVLSRRLGVPPNEIASF